MSDSSQTSFDEEPWEAEVSAMLGGLPAVEPPPGFLERAADHRPLFAGRTMAGFGLAALLAVSGAAAIGRLDPRGVVPEVDDLAVRHSIAVSAGADDDFAPVDDPDAPPVSLPNTYEEQASFVGDDVSQSVFSNSDESISVFSQRGRVDWSKLPSDGLDDIDGKRAWFDPDRGVLVVEADDEAITIVGLSAQELPNVLDGLSVGSSSSWVDGLANVTASLTGELGFGG